MFTILKIKILFVCEEVSVLICNKINYYFSVGIQIWSDPFFGHPNLDSEPYLVKMEPGAQGRIILLTGPGG